MKIQVRPRGINVLKIDIFCMFPGENNEERQCVDVDIKEEREET